MSRFGFWLTAKAACVVILSLLARPSSGAAEDPATAPKPPAPYVPGLGEFMTSAVQPHHIKIWQAGQAHNWPLAEYEAKELRETFEDIATYQGTWNGFPIAKLAESNLNPPLDALDKAIEAKDAAGFKKAYDQIGTACNSCHQATDNGFIAIRTPSGADFPDQDFRPH